MGHARFARLASAGLPATSASEHKPDRKISWSQTPRPSVLLTRWHHAIGEGREAARGAGTGVATTLNVSDPALGLAAQHFVVHAVAGIAGGTCASRHEICSRSGNGSDCAIKST